MLEFGNVSTPDAHFDSNDNTEPQAQQHLDLSHRSAPWSKLQPYFQKSLPELTSLDLSHNNLNSNDMVTGLAVFVCSSCPKLQKLNLSNNCIGKQGIVALLVALRFCPDLQSLNVTSNFGSHSSQPELLKWLQSNKDITQLTFDVHRPSTSRALQFHLQQNRFGRARIQNYSQPMALWSVILATSSTDMTYEALRERPDVVLQTSRRHERGSCEHYL